MLHGRNNENVLHMKELLFPWEKESFVPAMAAVQNLYRVWVLEALDRVSIFV